MANEMIKFLRGNVENLPQTATAGALYFTKNEGIYMGMEDGSYHRYGDFITVADVNSLPATGAHATCMYYCSKENILARYDSANSKWVQINKQPDAETLKTLLGLGTLAYKSEVVEGDLNAALVEKINASAEGNHSHSNKGVLDGITAEKVTAWDAAEKNAKDHADGLAEAIQNGETINDFAGVEAEFEKVVYAETGKSLIADTEIARLAGMSDGANKVEKSDTNGNIKVDGAEVVVYTHPEKHAIADVAGLQDALNGLQAKGDYAAEEHTHTKDEITDFAHTHVAADITDLDATIKGYDYATKDELGNVDKKFADYKTAADQKTIDDEQDRRLGVLEAKPFDTYAVKTEVEGALALKADKSVVDAMYTNGQIDTAVQGAKDFAQGLVDAIPAQTDYTVTITENTDDATVAKTYVFTQNGEEIGAIKLAKELVVTSGSVKEVETADAPYTGAKVGDKYIELVIANQDAPIYVPAKDLVDIYTAKDGAAEVQVAISNTNEISATLVNGGITEEKLAEGVKTKLNKVWEEVGVAQGLVDGLANGQVKTNKEAIEAINNAENGILAQAKADAQTKADAAKDAAIADAAGKYETKGTAQGIVDGLKLSETYEPIGAEGRAIAAAETKAGELDTALHTAISKEIDDDVKAAIDAEVLRADGAYDKKGDAAAAQSAAIADAATKYETIGTAQGIVDGLKLSETYEAIGAEGRAIAAAKTETENQVKALAGEGNTSTVKKNADDIASLFEQLQWGEF